MSCCSLMIQKQWLSILRNKILRPTPATAASWGKEKKKKEKKCRSLTVITGGFIYPKCLARQVCVVTVTWTALPLGFSVSQVSSAPACSSQVMKPSKHRETLLTRRRKTGIHSDATGGNRLQTVDQHWSEIMSNALSYDFWRKEFASWFSGIGTQLPSCARELVPARSEPLCGVHLKVSVHVWVFQPDT